MRGKLFESDYRPQFTGHETFPLRYGWLKKAFDAVKASQGRDNKFVFGEEAIAQFGVGKNMVDGLRHWARATSIIIANSTGYEVPPFGLSLFVKTAAQP